MSPGYAVLEHKNSASEREPAPWVASRTHPLIKENHVCLIPYTWRTIDCGADGRNHRSVPLPAMNHVQHSVRAMFLQIVHCRRTSRCKHIDFDAISTKDTNNRRSVLTDPRQIPPAGFRLHSVDRGRSAQADESHCLGKSHAGSMRTDIGS